MAQSAGAVEYTDCISAVGYDSPKYPGYDTKKSDGESAATLELWGKWNTLFLPLSPGPLWPSVVEPDRVLSMGQRELNCNHTKFKISCFSIQ